MSPGAEAGASAARGRPRRGAKVIRLPRSDRVERCNEELVRQYQQDRSPEVLQEILDRNDGLIHAVLKRFPYFPDPYEDLVQVARLGMIKAVQRFELDRGVEFSSYATAVIDGEVRHYLRDSTLMHQPRWLRSCEKRIEQASMELARKLNRTPTLKEIAEEVNITEEGIAEILRVRALTSLHRIDDPATADNFNPDPDRDSISSLRYESFSLPIEDEIALHEAFRALSGFHRRLVYLLFYKDLTQTEAARQLGLTQRKVSREVAKALTALKAALNTKVF